MDLGDAICLSILFKNGGKLDLLNKKKQKPLDVAIETQQAYAVTFLKLAQMTMQEGGSQDEASFYEALDSFLESVYNQQNQSNTNSTTNNNNS